MYYSKQKSYGLKTVTIKASFYLFVAVALGVLCSSCATLFQGTTKSVLIRSTTPGAKIFVDGDYKGTGIVRLKLKRKRSHEVLVKKEGYITQSAFINRELQAGWLVWGIVVCQPCLVIDAISNSYYTFDKDRITFDLDKERKVIIQQQPLIINNNNKQE